MEFVNLTPHEIVETTTGAKFPSSKQTARVSVRYTKNGEVDGIPLFEAQYGEVEGLPEPQQGIVYIVSSLVLEAMKGKRSDIVAPGELVRDKSGQPIGCLGFKRS